LCSPGFNLPVGRLTRSVNDGYPQYHSSADDLTLMSAARLEQSLDACKQVVEALESNRRYINLMPKGEPRLGKRGLYGAVGGRSPAERERAMLWVLNQSDGSASLLDIAQRSGVSLQIINQVADELAGAALLRTADKPRPEPAPAFGKPPSPRKKKAAPPRARRHAQPTISSRGRRK
jgi:aminopeptidase-like protein